MAKNKDEIISDFKSYMSGEGNYSDWYVGITADPKKRLFTEHKVDEKNGIWIYREAFGSESARAVEDYFVNKLGTKGDVGGGDDTSNYVYAYKITSYTAE